MSKDIPTDRHMQQDTPDDQIDLDMTHWDLDDGGVGATIDGIDDVFLFASNEAQYIAFVPWLIDTMRDQMQAGKAAGLKAGVFKIKMTFARIDGSFCVRFDDWLGVGVQAPNQERFKAWMFQIGKVAAKNLTPAI